MSNSEEMQGRITKQLSLVHGTATTLMNEWKAAMNENAKLQRLLSLTEEKISASRETQIALNECREKLCKSQRNLSEKEENIRRLNKKITSIENELMENNEIIEKDKKTLATRFARDLDEKSRLTNEKIAEVHKEYDKQMHFKEQIFKEREEQWIDTRKKFEFRLAHLEEKVKEYKNGFESAKNALDFESMKMKEMKDMYQEKVRKLECDIGSLKGKRVAHVQPFSPHPLSPKRQKKVSFSTDIESKSPDFSTKEDLNTSNFGGIQNFSSFWSSSSSTSKLSDPKPILKKPETNTIKSRMLQSWVPTPQKVKESKPMFKNSESVMKTPMKLPSGDSSKHFLWSVTQSKYRKSAQR